MAKTAKAGAFPAIKTAAGSYDNHGNKIKGSGGGAKGGSGGSGG